MVQDVLLEPVMPATIRMSFRAAVVVVLALIVTSVSGPSARAAEDSQAQSAARAVVEGFHAKLLDVMKNAKVLGIKGRFDQLAPEIAKRFNLKLMVAIATGNAWSSASPADRERLADAFGRFSSATYASRFDGYSGQSFETTAVAPGPRGTMMVTTRINRPNDAPVKLAYVTRPSEAGWQIVDVLVDDGISELAVRRSEYSGILSRNGMPGLIAEIDGKAKSLLAE